jgi:hypothetical protein
MGLDAVVYCSCFEQEKVRSPPPAPAVVDTTGAVEAATTDADQLARFDRWRMDSCNHEDGVLIHHYLGNIALVAVLRERLESMPQRFPLLLSRVLYNGTHAGDHLPVSLLASIADEVGAIDLVPPQNADEEQRLKHFQLQMLELLKAARDLGKPICF